MREADEAEDEQAATPDLAQSVTFLLSQLGFHAALSFSERVEAIELCLPHVGIMQMVAACPGESQQALATKLGIAPNRLVGLLDELEQRDLLRRERLLTDRRVSALKLSPEGERMLGEVRRVGAEHDAAITAALDPDESAELAAQLRRIADQQGLEHGVHPALRKLR